MARRPASAGRSARCRIGSGATPSSPMSSISRSVATDCQSTIRHDDLRVTRPSSRLDALVRRDQRAGPDGRRAPLIPSVTPYRMRPFIRRARSGRTRTRRRPPAAAWPRSGRPSRRPAGRTRTARCRRRWPIRRSPASDRTARTAGSVSSAGKPGPSSSTRTSTSPSPGSAARRRRSSPAPPYFAALDRRLRTTCST